MNFWGKLGRYFLETDQINELQIFEILVHENIEISPKYFLYNVTVLYLHNNVLFFI